MSKPNEPEWLTQLARAGASAQAQKQHRDRRLCPTGAASEGKRLMRWACPCGWAGSSRELKAGPDGICCPACGGAPRAA
jgi:hypothetical protein